MREGRSGIATIAGEGFAKFDGKWSVTIGGQVKGFDPSRTIDPREVKRLDRCTQLGMGAAAEGVAHSVSEF